MTAAIARNTAQSDDLFSLVTSPKMQSALTRALPGHIKPERMLRIILTALRSTPKLAQCQQGSVIGSLLQLVQLGLEPNTPLGHAYLVPFYNAKQGGLVCTPIVGYKGMIELAYRSGRIQMLAADVVREGDAFSYRYSFEPDFSFERKSDLKAPLTHAWCWGTTKDGGRFMQVLTAQDVEARKARSQASKSGPWVTDTAAMWRKTAIRAAQWRLPQSPEMQRAEVLSQVEDGGLGLADALDAGVLDVIAEHKLDLPEPEERQADAPSEARPVGDSFFDDGDGEEAA